MNDISPAGRFSLIRQDWNGQTGAADGPEASGDAFEFSRSFSQALTDTWQPEERRVSAERKAPDKAHGLCGRLIRTDEMPPSLEILPVPDTRQGTDYTCGASALQAVLMYYGQEFREDELVKMLGTTENGTNPGDIVRVSRGLGYRAELRDYSTLADLEESLKRKEPVIISCQAWRDGQDQNKPWNEVWDSGHYMVVIGMDRENVYFEDPSLLGSKGVIARDEFMERWHDVDDRKYMQLGIFLRGKAPAPPPPFIHVDYVQPGQAPAL